MIDYRPQNNNKGIALSHQKAFDQALAVFQQVVAINPDFAVAHYNIGNVYSDLGKPDEAIASYHRFLLS